MAGHRQVLLLGLATLLVLLAIGGTGTALTKDARAELRTAERRLGRPLRALEEVETNLAELVSGYLHLLTLLEAEAPLAPVAAARLGQSHEGTVAAWRDYRAAARGLQGEAAVVERLAEVMEMTLEEGRTFLTSAVPVAPTDAGALVARLAIVRTGAEGLGGFERDIDLLIDLYDAEATRAEVAATARLDDVLVRTSVVAAVAGVPLLAAFALVGRAARRRERAAAALAVERDAGADRNEFEARLQRGFDMVRSEDTSYPVIEQALRSACGAVPAELLVADSSTAHLRQVVSTDPATSGPGCAVGSPLDCPAAQRSQTQLFATSEAIDACPFLRGRPGGDRSAVCVPVNIAGKTAGVIHAAGEPGAAVSAETVARLELVARKAGDRLGMLRAFARSENQARTDPLTGLLNRRSLEAESREAVDSVAGYTVAFGDLDHFKRLNDTHGHDAGDRALRLFARVLRDAVRPIDIPARYGGEEFVIVLPACGVGDATAVLDRLRSRLAEVLLQGSVPPFTVSFGVAGSEDGARLADVIERADAALLAAKAAGRDRTVVSGAPSLPV